MTLVNLSDVERVFLDGWKRFPSSDLFIQAFRSLPSVGGGEAGLVDTLRQEAQIHAQEARTQRATVLEIYQLVSDGKGEPGDWNGAEPVRKLLRLLRAKAALADEYAEHCKAHEDLSAGRTHYYHLLDKRAWLTRYRALTAAETEGEPSA